MNFIIDANNLAGKMGFLGSPYFDKQLISVIEDWLGDKQKVVVLVFDSLDPLGDRITKGFLEIVYSPRDGYYKTADDKIIEIFKQWAIGNQSESYSLNIIKRLAKHDLAFVSDDLDLVHQINELKEEINENTQVISGSEFVSMIERKEYLEEGEEVDEDRGMSEDEIDDINEELLEMWT